jgi:hypothetical protein
MLKNQRVNFRNRSCPSYQPDFSTGSGVTLSGPGGAGFLAQLSQIGFHYSEDCLKLNIWSRPQTGEKAKAVLFWIHGGGEKSVPFRFAIVIHANPFQVSILEVLKASFSTGKTWHIQKTSWS